MIGDLFPFRFTRLVTYPFEDTIFDLVGDMPILYFWLKTFDEVFVVHGLVEGAEAYLSFLSKTLVFLHHFRMVSRLCERGITEAYR